MPIHKWPLNELLISRIFEFANTPFTLDAFRQKWTTFGWTHESKTGDEFGFRVQIGGGLSFNIDPAGDRVVGAALPFCYWEGYDPQFRSDIPEFERERTAFNTEFLSTAQLTERLLAAPFAHWHDSDHDAHRAKVWAGKNGLLILQEASFDLQFGMELNFWLVSLSPAKFSPTSPLIDWLCEYSRIEHAKAGFPKITRE